MSDRGKDRHIKNDHRRNYMKNYHRAYSLENDYGISVDQFIIMLVEQKNACVICERVFQHDKPKRGKDLSPHVDHCHSTGKIRGLLCDRCNVSMGRFEDNPVLLRRAASYLIRNKGTQPGEKK